MFGIVPKDSSGKCLSVSDKLNVSGNVYISSHQTPVRQIITVPPLDNTAGNVSYTLFIDNTTSKIGDIAIVFFSTLGTPGTINQAVLNFPANLYVSRARDQITFLDIKSFSYFAMYFVFDGDVFITTFENC